MSKTIEFIKRNKSAVIVLSLLLILIVLAITLNKGNNQSSKSTYVSTQNKSVAEIKLEQILNGMEGVGEAEVLINEGENGIEGIIVVCDGANNLMTRSNILNVITTAMNVKENNIAIYAMNKQ